jgi:peptidoglycan LD-endopeptidase CwlK
MSIETKIAELKPKVGRMVAEFVKRCKTELGVSLLITEAYRSPERQNILYAQGRTTKGHIVTNAKAGQSIHQYKCAVDIVPIIGGKLAWNYDFKKLGKIGVACGLEWGGNWKSFKDMPHFQYTAGYLLKDFQAGKIDEKKFL